MNRVHAANPLSVGAKRTGSRFLWAIFFAGALIFSAHAAAADGLSISSPAFANRGQMPPRFAHTHDNISPPLSILVLKSGPWDSRSYVLIVNDPDAPSGLFTHWLVWNIQAQPQTIAEGHVPAGAVQGRNSFGNAHYDGPAPPNGRHRYFFYLYGLDTTLSLPAGSDREALEAAMIGHIVATAPIFYGTFATGQ
jgi:Raf kinase inhibitor-like YbhB/YbcL family protein